MRSTWTASAPGTSRTGAGDREPGRLRGALHAAGRGGVPGAPGRRADAARETRRHVEAVLIGLEEEATPWWRACWDRGAAEDEPVDRLFDDLGALQPGLHVLHGLRVAGTSSSIDHVLVGPAGVVVADTEGCAGRVRSDGVHLRVGRRDWSGTVDLTLWQTEVVRAELGRRGLGDVPVHGVLHWRHLGGLGTKAICLRGIPLLSAGAVVALALNGVRVSPWTAERVATLLRPGAVHA